MIPRRLRCFKLVLEKMLWRWEFMIGWRMGGILSKNGLGSYWLMVRVWAISGLLETGKAMAGSNTSLKPQSWLELMVWNLQMIGPKEILKISLSGSSTLWTKKERNFHPKDKCATIKKFTRPKTSNFNRDGKPIYIDFHSPTLYQMSCLKYRQIMEMVLYNSGN